MRLLLDTHVLFWALVGSPRLNTAAREAILDDGNEVFISAASLWEAAIKRSVGKLHFDTAKVLAELARNGFRELPITLRHAVAAGDLPLHHKDPFDRMLIGQAVTEGLTIVTGDAALKPYGVTALWT